MKHTPGPWEIRNDLPYTSHGKVIFHGYHEDNRTICRLREGTEQEREANARLIATAPELLEALDMMMAYCIILHGEIGTCPSEIEECSCDFAAKYAQAEAAIRKATGEL
jgi:hypothetical protein